MPSLSLSLNFGIPNEGFALDSTIKAISKAIAEVTGKPESYVAVHLNMNQVM